MRTLFDTLVADLARITMQLQARQADMRRYLYVMDRVWLCDVRNDADFQRTFNGLYMVRRGHAWRAAFYQLFEHQKSANSNFDEVLRAIHAATGRIEASFASKLLATIKPAMPVYDSWVRINLGLKIRTGAANLRIPQLIADYSNITQTYEALIAEAHYPRLRDGFDKALPALRHLGDIKKIDLLFWQAREPAPRV